MAVDGKNIQYYGGTTEQHKTYTAPSRAISVDTSKNVLVIHDGATPGGHPLASAAMEIDAAEPLSIISGGNLGENTEIGLNISADEKNILRVQDGGLLASRDELADMWGIHRNIGDLVYSTLPQINDKSLHLLDGSVLARADYVDLFALIDELYKDGSYDNLFMSEADWQTSVTAYGVCGKFVYDEAAATLRLPKVTGFVEGTLDSAALGDLTEAGLPGINGTIRTLGSALAEADGAFFIPSTTSITGGHPASSTEYQNFIGLNASRSSPIYGNSVTVQPQSVKVYIYMVVANRFESAVSKVDELTELIQNLSMRNHGEMVYSLLPVEDAGLHLLDGSLLAANGMYAEFIDYVAGLQADYPGLFVTETDWQASVTQYGVCGKFVYDDTAGTLRLPKVTGFVEGTIDATAIGSLVEAGLPNITGALGGTLSTVAGSGESGAFYWAVKNYDQRNSYVAGNGGAHMTFDASLSSSIYGNSTTVQPQAIKGYVYMVVASRNKTPVNADIDRIAADLQLLNSMVNPAGTVIAFAGNTSSAPAGYLLCNGAAISRTTYANLFTAIGTTYGTGDGSTTFNLPNLTDRFIQGSGTAGTVKAAGLPNITGVVIFPNFRFPSEPVVTGAYYNRPESPAGARFSGSGSYTDWHFPGFDASLSNSIYGNSDTVQPPALTMRYYIKY